jgi:hypothetical protein
MNVSYIHTLSVTHGGLFRDNILLCTYQLYTHKFSLTNGGVLRDPHVMFLCMIVILYTQTQCDKRRSFERYDAVLCFECP